MNLMSYSHLCFLFLVTCVAVQRVLELRRSLRNEITLRMRGASEFSPEHFPWMRLVHILWLVGCIVESFFVSSVPSGTLIMGVILFACGQLLRTIAIETLGSRWTVRILVLPAEKIVTKGIYRYLRHPNYLGVILELIGLPLIGGCWWTASIIFVANLAVLSVRIRREEAALTQAMQNLATVEA